MIKILLNQILSVFNIVHCSFDCYRDVTLSGFVVYGAPLRMMLGSEHVDRK
jgi:hypothetical protein